MYNRRSEIYANEVTCRNNSTGGRQTHEKIVV